jgi:hypothetical protein
VKMNSITVVCPLVFFLLAIMLSVFLRFTYSDYPFLMYRIHNGSAETVTTVEMVPSETNNAVADAF